MQNAEKPLLTISILSSNRKDTIRKCLDSLNTLRERVACELIIVDTSQDESMLEILREYTDIILPFKWCRDFSKARNVGLNAARGKWFLYLDDDEWFIDTKDIEEFLLSGEYKKYCLAYYIQRNYADYEGKNFSDAQVSRMFAIENEIKFVSSIHEYPYPLIGESTLLHSVVEHYGYVYDTWEKRMEHFERNSTLLKDMIEKERGNPRWWVQLIQEYHNVDYYDEMERCCKEAIEVFKDEDYWDAVVGLGTYYNGLLTKYIKFDQFEEAETLYKKAIKDKRNTQTSQAALYCLGSKIYFHKKDYKKCLECCRKYEKLYELLHENDAEVYKQGYFFVHTAFRPINSMGVMCKFVSCGLKLKDPVLFKKYFWKIGWEEEKLYLDENIINDILEGFSTLPYDDEFVKMAEVIMQRNGIDNAVVDYIQRKESSDPKAFDHLSRIFVQTNSEHSLIRYLEVLGADTKDKTDEVLSRVTFDVWENIVARICKFAGAEVYEEKKKLFTENQLNKTSYRKYFRMRSAEKELCQTEKSYHCLQEHIMKYIEHTMDFYSCFFKEEAFTGEMELLPVRGRIAVKLQAVMDAQMRDDIRAVSAALKDAMGIYQPFDDVIKTYTKLYAVQQKKQLEEEKLVRDSENAAISTEMQQLGGMIKDKVRMLINQGMQAEAMQTLQQLKSLMPDDPELDLLEAAIKIR